MTNIRYYSATSFLDAGPFRIIGKSIPIPAVSLDENSGSKWLLTSFPQYRWLPARYIQSDYMAFPGLQCSDGPIPPFHPNPNAVGSDHEAAEESRLDGPL